MSVRGGLGVLAIVMAACSSRPLHVRGELDRRTWVVQNCDGSGAYRVMMTSNGAAEFLDIEKRLALTPSESAILEFDAATIPPKFPWDSHETVGVRGPLTLERGTCSASGTR